MESYNYSDIQEVPLGNPRFRAQVERFLQANGLKMEAMDSYYTISDADGGILAGAGLCGDTIKCVAVSESARCAGLSSPLVSRLVSEAAAAGFDNVKVFTKPGNAAVFSSLGFRLVGRSPKAVLMENGRGLALYVEYLASRRTEGRTGVAVMNANPLTLGHKYLIDKASRSVDRLFVIPVREDVSMFSYPERKAMLEEAAKEFPNVEVLEGSAYSISASTFPSYFLKTRNEASESQMLLDLDIFASHIAPALGAAVRFVGSEPSDALTAAYNEAMRSILPGRGVEVVEIPRLCLSAPSCHSERSEESPVSASAVRKAVDAGSLAGAIGLVPLFSAPYLLAELAGRALRLELEAPLKPGLVGPDGPGAHADMDFGLMSAAVGAIRRSMTAHIDLWKDPVVLGKAVEVDALAASGGVNTHRGAIFCLCLVVTSAWRHLLGELPGMDMMQALRELIPGAASAVVPSIDTHGGMAVNRYGVKGALQMALDGYRPLFEDWLPYYRSVEGEEYALQKTLLRIMSSLDDTCIIHRRSLERAREVKREAASLLGNFSAEGLKEMNRRFSEEGISPGGCADMLSLTLMARSLEI